MDEHYKLCNERREQDRRDQDKLNQEIRDRVIMAEADIKNLGTNYGKLDEKLDKLVVQVNQISIKIAWMMGGLAVVEIAIKFFFK